MNYYQSRKNSILRTCGNISLLQVAANKEMAFDMQRSLIEAKETIVIFDKPCCGFLGVSYIFDILSFIKGDGTLELAEDFINNESNYETLYQIWLKFRDNYQKAVIANMIADMSSYMIRHHKHMHCFNGYHCGYSNVNRIEGVFQFGSDLGKKLNFSELNESHFSLVCELYDAFYNDAFMPIED